MQRFAMTGSRGFLGWHTRAALRELNENIARVDVGSNFDQQLAMLSLEGVERLIHIAGVNRGTDLEVREGNLIFASQLAETIYAVENPPKTIVFANSTQAMNGSVYGDSKLEASEILSKAAANRGVDFIDLRLPNIFGEHGRPFYNAVTSTFCHLVSLGEQPEIIVDKELSLLHAQNAADLLIGNTLTESQAELEVTETVTALAKKIIDFSEIYKSGEIPDITNDFDRDLFNTYRSYTFPAQAPLKLTRHQDQRGSFFEVIRSHGGSGQSSFSTTESGISRGDHFHRRKIERFTVLSGKATISLRKLFSNDRIDFDVDGNNPVSVDMPTMWSHKIVNTSDETLFTSFWSNEIYDPINPDTIAETV